MSLEQPSDLELAILEHLATYRFLTNEQLLTLGVTKSERHLQAMLRGMAGLHRKPRSARVSEGGSCTSATSTDTVPTVPLSGGQGVYLRAR